MPPRFEESLSIAAPKSDPSEGSSEDALCDSQLKRDISQGPRHPRTILY